MRRGIEWHFQNTCLQGQQEASWALQGNGEGFDVAGGSDMSQLRLEEWALCKRTLGLKLEKFSNSVPLAAELHRECLITQIKKQCENITGVEVSYAVTPHKVLCALNLI